MAEQIVIGEKFNQLVIEEETQTFELVVKEEKVNLLTVQIPGPPGPPGADGTGGDLSYTHNQAVASSQWTVVHNLGKFPSITVVDTSGNVCEGKPQMIDQNQFIIYFSAPFSGKVYCN